MFLLLAVLFGICTMLFPVPDVDFDTAAAAKEYLFHGLVRSQVQLRPLLPLALKNRQHRDTYMLVSICTRYAIQLIPRQIRIMATVDEVVVQGVIEINRSSWGGCIGGGGGHVGEEFVVVRRKGELMELGIWEEANAG